MRRAYLTDAGRTYHNIDYGLTCHQCVHLVCSFYFFDNLYETLFPSDLGLVSFCCLGWLCFPFPRLLFEHEYVGLLSTSASPHLPYML